MAPARHERVGERSRRVRHYIGGKQHLDGGSSNQVERDDERCPPEQRARNRSRRVADLADRRRCALKASKREKGQGGGSRNIGEIDWHRRDWFEASPVPAALNE